MEQQLNCLRRFEKVPPTDDVLICTVTRGEILYRLERLPVGRRRRTLASDAQLFFDRIPCIAVPVGAAEPYARLKWQAQSRGVAIVENDLWIAATAVTLGALLVAADQDFSRLPGLHVENWSE
jgi:tRNA(fMet)-specific endonuclease VapC